MSKAHGGSALLTDLYQLTMLQGYFDQGMDAPAVFEFYLRSLPADRGFLVAAGLPQALEYLENLRFSDDDLRWLAGHGGFSDDFIDSLREFTFTGDVHGMAEGTVCFPDEPLLQVIAPLPQAQLVESRLINILHFQTLIASKAARCVLAAPDKLLVDFGMRRAHGAEAGLMAARACYLAGFGGTATALAAPLFGIPVFGTMAHSFVLAHERELDAFAHFAHAQPQNVVLLIDTYDTEQGARRAVEIAPQLRAEGIAIKAVRLDSGDLITHARKVREILDDGGLQNTGIFASGNLDEVELARIAAAEAPIDGFGVGTLLDTSADAPYLDCAYKLQEYAGKPRRKRSEGKANWPGRKQVFRRYDENGRIAGDLVCLISEQAPGQPLLQPVMKGGQTCISEDLEAARRRCAEQLAQLPHHLHALHTTPAYRVTVSDELRRLAATMDRELH